MPELAFEIARDPRGSLVHVRSRQSGECLGCIEVGLYEIVRMLILSEREKTIAVGDRLGKAVRC